MNYQLINQMAQKYGTPLYFYQGDKIMEQINALKTAFSGIPFKIKYAMKALSNINILKLMSKNGVGIDAVSIEEVQLAPKAGVNKSDILYTPNSVSFNEVKQAVELGVKINIDNLSILESFGSFYGANVPCSVRINPHLMAGGNLKISTGHIDSKFGISIHQIHLLKKITDQFNMNINGLHVHSGSDILDAEVFIQMSDIIFSMAENFKNLEFIDFGSGFKVKYKPEDYETDVHSLAQKLVPRFKEFSKSYGKNLELWFEPGKFLVSEAGLLLVSVNTIKTTPTNVFVGVNSGLNHLIRPMMYDAYHAIENVTNVHATKRIYTVVGNICETDTLGRDRQLSEVREGDILAIKNAGAYGFSMSSQYNSRTRPAEVLFYQNKDSLIRRRETLDDILLTQIEIEL